MAARRADYFEAGTLVVWDVDPIAECVHVYRAAVPDQPESYSRGQEVDAEPVVPGWRVAVDWRGPIPLRTPAASMQARWA